MGNDMILSFNKKSGDGKVPSENFVVPLQPHLITTYSNSGQIWLLATT
jgi:hypothetical protein